MIAILFIIFYIAERQGFEPRVPRSTTVFKTAAIDHSAISPDAGANIEVFIYFKNYFSLFFPEHTLR